MVTMSIIGVPEGSLHDADILHHLLRAQMVEEMGMKV